MNRIFKTKWSDSHKQYVVTDENHSNKGKTAKSAVTMAVSALMLVAGAASATYMEPGFKAQDAAQMGQAKTSWEISEKLGLVSIESIHCLCSWFSCSERQSGNDGFRNPDHT